jgi:hypothetical protein
MEDGVYFYFLDDFFGQITACVMQTWKEVTDISENTVCKQI